jgi:hypothetical protein
MSTARIHPPHCEECESYTVKLETENERLTAAIEQSKLTIKRIHNDYSQSQEVQETLDLIDQVLNVKSR